MKRTIKFVLGFALLGALVGACLPIFVGTSPAVTYGLPYWYDDYLNPVVVVWVLTIPVGLILGALTGLASAFSSVRFATVRCLLAITIPALLAGTVFAPPRLKQRFFWACSFARLLGSPIF